MHFYKMHGTGNDFVLLENLENKPWNYPALARSFCALHTGIGADGVLVLLPSEKADFQMKIFNADGSEAEMCGNGIRCFSRHLYEKGFVQKTKFKIETLAGIMEPECILSNGKVQHVRVNMGKPRYGDLHLKAGQPLTLDAEHLVFSLEFSESRQNNEALARMVEGASISMGNPHFVVFTDGNSPWNLEEHGKALSVHPKHPHQSNVEFVDILNFNRIRVKVWERGVGPTQACGSGACASVVACRILKKMPEKLEVEMPGGVLHVEWDGQGAVFLSGPATYVFEGDVSEEFLKNLL